MLHQEIVVLNNQDGVNNADGFTNELRKFIVNVKQIDLVSVRVSGFNTLITTEQYVHIDIPKFSPSTISAKMDSTFVIPVTLDASNVLIYDELTHFKQSKVIATEGVDFQSLYVRFLTHTTSLDVSAKYATVMLRVHYIE